MKKKNLKIGNKTKDGTVKVLYDPNLYLEVTCAQYPHLKENHRWDLQFPGWRNEVVVGIELDPPQKQMSIEEFRQQCPWIKEEFLNERYEKEIPYKSALSIPLQAVNL